MPDSSPSGSGAPRSIARAVALKQRSGSASIKWRGPRDGGRTSLPTPASQERRRTSPRGGGMVSVAAPRPDMRTPCSDAGCVRALSIFMSIASHLEREREPKDERCTERPRPFVERAAIRCPAQRRYIEPRPHCLSPLPRGRATRPAEMDLGFPTQAEGQTSPRGGPLHRPRWLEPLFVR